MKSKRKKITRMARLILVSVVIFLISRVEKDERDAIKENARKAELAKFAESLTN